MAVSVKLKDVRLSFPNLWVPKAHPSKPEALRFDASFLVEPGSANDKLIQGAILEAATEKLGKKAAAFLNSVKGNNMKYCYTQGDLKNYNGYAGMLVLASHRRAQDGPPLVIHNYHVPLSEQLEGRKYTEPSDPSGPRFLKLTAEDGKPYAGCYVNASVDIYVQDDINGGVRCGLKGVQFARDGDAFSGSAAAKPDDFEAIEDGAQAGGLL